MLALTFTFALLALLQIQIQVASAKILQVTTLLTTANGTSALECWRLDAPFTTSTGAGTVGASTLQLGALANATYTVLPAQFEGGVHNAPFPQWVVFTSGVAHITLPANSSSDAWVFGGRDGLILAIDTTGQGHNTSYPSAMETVALQIPFADGAVPAHEVVSVGACAGEQVQDA